MQKQIFISLEELNMENNLRQATNSIVIIGTLKALDVKEGSKDGVKSISMTATISSKVGDQVHENKVNFFAKENSKLYKGYKTMATEYKVEKDREIKSNEEIDVNSVEWKVSNLKKYITDKTEEFTIIINGLHLLIHLHRPLKDQTTSKYHILFSFKMLSYSTRWQ